MKPRLALAICFGLFASRARADDHTYLAPTALVQTELRGLPSEEENPGFTLPRVRLGVWSEPVPWMFALAQMQFSPEDEAPVVLDAYARFGPWHGLRITAGYFRSPLFVSARNELDGMTPLPELSMPVKALWPRRDLAVELHYAPALPLEVWLRVGNGNPSPTENDLNGAFAVTARVDATFGRARIDAHGNETFGLRVGAAGVVDADSYDRAGAAGITMSEFEFYRPPTVSGTRRIFEGHVLAYAGPVRLLVEAGGAVEDRSASNGNPSSPRVRLDPEITRGIAGEVSWMLTGEKRVSSVWPFERRRNPFSFAHPAIEIAARVERLDVGLGMRDFARGGATAASFAANAYLNALAGVTLAASYYRYDVAPIEEPTRLDAWLVQARLTVYLNPPPLGPPGLARPPMGAASSRW